MNPMSKEGPYETDQMNSIYCDFDYGERVKFMGSTFPNFPVL